MPTPPLPYPSPDTIPNPDPEAPACEHCRDSRISSSQDVCRENEGTPTVFSRHIVLFLCPACMTEGDKDKAVLLPVSMNPDHLTNEELLERAV